jgi:hypothetical protein
MSFIDSYCRTSDHVCITFAPILTKKKIDLLSSLLLPTSCATETGTIPSAIIATALRRELGIAKTLVCSFYHPSGDFSVPSFYRFIDFSVPSFYRFIIFVVVALFS